MAWIAGPTFVNPLGGTVWVDTGPLRPAFYLFQVFATANTGVEVLIQHRDAANLVTLKQKTLPVTLSAAFFALPSAVWLAQDERFRIVQRGDVSDGEVEVSLFLEVPGLGSQLAIP